MILMKPHPWDKQKVSIENWKMTEIVTKEWNPKDKCDQIAEEVGHETHDTETSKSLRKMKLLAKKCKE